MQIESVFPRTAAGGSDFGVQPLLCAADVFENGRSFFFFFLPVSGAAQLLMLTCQRLRGSPGGDTS